MRAAPEQQMIADIHCMIAAGQDLDWIDAHGATLVRTWTKAKTGQNGSGPACGGNHTSTVGASVSSQLVFWLPFTLVGWEIHFSLPHLLLCPSSIPMVCFVITQSSLRILLSS